MFVVNSFILGRIGSFCGEEEKDARLEKKKTACIAAAVIYDVIDSYARSLSLKSFSYLL